MILYSDEKTCELESNGSWIACVQYLLEKWRANKDNAPLMLKLSVNTWYTLTLDGPELSLRENESEFLSQSLLEVYRCSSEWLKSDDTCQWLFGYMMEVRTDLFLSTGLEYAEIEQKGKTLIRESSENGNIFAKLLFATDHQSKKEIREFREKVKEHISKCFDESQEVDGYFIEVLTADY